MSGIQKKIDDYFAKINSKIAKNKYLSVVARNFGWIIQSFARALVCSYFFNQGVSNFTYWYSYGVPGFPWIAVITCICTIPVLFNLYVHIFAWVLSFEALKDTVHISWHQFAGWWYHGESLYINELMVKKFSMLGCVILVLITDPFFKEKIDSSKKALNQLIVDSPKFTFSNKISIALLISRILISTLFLFVGYGEITRQWAMMSTGVEHQGHSHRRPDGDGHDNFWPKIAEFSFVIPFLIGYKTSWTARIIAIVLILESLIYWRWWGTTLGDFYAIHARDHFTVNVGVAGGLLLLQTMGGGTYSVDELLKKKD